ncbi:prephenate dehydrogenase/arogenate dehydrogenase family protein [Methylococcus sp. EFPC2]|uniref:prephenate dehydrogenase n=1 Tax=Methylococcus sp. EFPC2 TaxID=2812648 RepID=UPI0019670433|nr:prephenate dehydrogenase/arogenate dehydrogenase family protein [Methylococcus sp. EFPC2]QSA95549.1 prephenate dehydrogenase/arogenate dehydrogenase family protein [Methylococcus sp. EFPC2]
MIGRLCVIGVGLIGGSIAKAARTRGLCREIVGVDADAANLARALELGVIDAGYPEIAPGLDGTDWVLIATPVGAFEPVLAAIRTSWSADAVYTDVGSTKQSVIAAARRVFGEVPVNFVPGHPIAGAEKSGVEAAKDDLYTGRRVILTPTTNTDEQALRRVEAFWQALGARVTRMDPAHHDEVLAATSHLPHVLAYALVHMLGRKDEQQEIFQYAAGGFRDFTRIASSDPTMWLDICLANREQIVPLLAQLSGELGRVADLLETGAADELFDYFAEARGARQRYLDQSEKQP